MYWPKWWAVVFMKRQNNRDRQPMKDDSRPNLLGNLGSNSSIHLGLIRWEPHQIVEQKIRFNLQAAKNASQNLSHLGTFHFQFFICIWFEVLMESLQRFSTTTTTAFCLVSVSRRRSSCAPFRVDALSRIGDVRQISFSIKSVLLFSRFWTWISSYSCQNDFDGYSV